MALVYDLAEPRELQGYVRAALAEVNRNRFVLSQFLPNNNIDEIDFRVATGSLTDQDAATVRAWDTPSAIASRQGVSRIMGELPPISRKIRLGEEERLRKRALERGTNNELISAIFDDAANMARAVAARIELLRGEALEKGSITLNENGFVQTVDFGRAPTHAPAALVGAAQWSNPTTAHPVTDLTGWVETYRDTNGIDPALILTSTKVINYLLRVDEIRNMGATLAGTPTMATRDQVRAVFTAFDLPPMVAYDVKVRVNGAQVRVITDDKVIMIPPSNEPLGKTFLGTTAEALELAGASQISQDEAPGMVSVVEKTFDPVSTWTKAVAIALPVMINPNLTFVADVI